MPLEADLVSLAKSDVALYRIVGDAISFNLADVNDPLPYVIFEQVTDEPVRHMGGRTGTTMYEYRVSCYGRTREEASLVRNSVIDVFDEKRGPIGSSSVQIMYCEGATDSPVGPLPGQEQLIPCLSCTLTVYARELTAASV